MRSSRGLGSCPPCPRRGHDARRTTQISRRVLSPPLPPLPPSRALRFGDPACPQVPQVPQVPQARKHVGSTRDAGSARAAAQCFSCSPSPLPNVCYFLLRPITSCTRAAGASPSPNPRQSRGPGDGPSHPGARISFVHVFGRCIREGISILRGQNEQAGDRTVNIINLVAVPLTLSCPELLDRQRARNHQLNANY